MPGDISILEASEVSDDFHARFSATERTYLYYLLSRPARPGIHHGKIGWVHYPLDLEKMQMAAKLLIGKHDFSAFRSSECQSRTAIRQLTRLNISQHQQLFVLNSVPMHFCIIWFETFSADWSILAGENILLNGCGYSWKNVTVHLPRRHSRRMDCICLVSDMMPDGICLF